MREAGLIRAVSPGVEVREGRDGGKATLFGHFARFGSWTTIDNAYEGRFLEEVAPGAFVRTMVEDRSSIRCLFQHGHDPQIGSKPLGRITDLREDGVGAWYEVELSNTSFNDDLRQLLADGLLGASFRFKVMRDEVNKNPGESEHNPDGLDERTLREVRLFEFGPVTFSAYASASAGVRSIGLTDEFIQQELSEVLLRDAPPSPWWSLSRRLSLDEELEVRSRRLAEIRASSHEMARPLALAETSSEAFWRGVDDLLRDPRVERDEAAFKDMTRKHFWRTD